MKTTIIALILWNFRVFGFVPTLDHHDDIDFKKFSCDSWCKTDKFVVLPHDGKNSNGSVDDLALKYNFTVLNQVK